MRRELIAYRIIPAIIISAVLLLCWRAWSTWNAKQRWLQDEERAKMLWYMGQQGDTFPVIHNTNAVHE